MHPISFTVLLTKSSRRHNENSGGKVRQSEVEVEFRKLRRKIYVRMKDLAKDGERANELRIDQHSF